MYKKGPWEHLKRDLQVSLTEQNEGAPAREDKLRAKTIPVNRREQEERKRI